MGKRGRNKQRASGERKWPQQTRKQFIKQLLSLALKDIPER